MSNSLRPYEPQHARPPCPSPTPESTQTHVHWVSDAIQPQDAISSSVIPFSSCPQSFPASGSFPMSQFFASGGQSIGVSASTSFLPMNTQGLVPTTSLFSHLPSSRLQMEEPWRGYVSPQWLTSAQQCARAFCLKAPDMRIPLVDIYPKETFPQECIVGGSKMLSTIYKGKQI